MTGDSDRAASARGPTGGGVSGGAARRPVEVDLGPLPRRLGRYEVLERIGSGGMGTVFRARQLPIDRIVALKVLSPDLANDRRYIKRFVREARAAGALNHPNVVLVHDVGRVEGHPYICMEHVDGTSVERLIRERGRLPADEAVSIAVDVARALERAHREGIIHRDVKPDNILVDTRGVVKLTDLGLAHAPSAPGSESVTREGVGMGTPHYMAVEQARDARRADARSDLYSLGATLYHMLTGRVPFDGDSAVDILMRAAEEPLASPAEFVPGLPTTVVQVVERMMAKDPGARYQSASDLLVDLEAVRNELAGLGAAKLAGALGAPRAPEGAGRLLVEIAGALGALVLAGLLALAVGGDGEQPAPAPLFERGAAEPPDDGGSPPPEEPAPGGEAPAPPAAAGDDAGRGGKAPEERAPASPNGDADLTAPEPDSPSERLTLREATRQARWYERAGRHGDAASALRGFAGSTTSDRDRARAAAALEKLYARAEADSAATLARARDLLAAGRHEKGMAALKWALDVWGMPVLEARAEAAMEKARRDIAASAGRDVERERAEGAARSALVSAEKAARRRSFGEAAKLVDGALAAMEALGGAARRSAVASELERRKKVLKALEVAHAAAALRLAREGFGIPASEVFPDWPQDAVIARADSGGIEIDLPGTGGPRARKSWDTLTPEQYASLVETCARARRPAEILGAGLAWLEAGRPDEAMRVWQTQRLEPEETSPFLEKKDGNAAVEDALGRARRLDAAGREREALAALAPVFEIGLAGPDEDPDLGRLAKSLAQEVDASCGLATSCRQGPGETAELCYDFSRKDWRHDWRTGAGRLRQAEQAVVSPSGGLCTLEFEGPFVSSVEVAVSLRILEEAGAGVEVAFVPDDGSERPAAISWATVEGLADASPRAFVPLVKCPLDVLFLRRWEEVSFLAAPGQRGGAAAGVPGRGCPRGVDAADAPRGPERVVLTLVGWVELRAVRLRGVVDPEWCRRRRGARVTEAEEALERAREEADPALRARRLEDIRGRFPACRGVGLRATLEAVRAHVEAGDPSRAEAARGLARGWYPDIEGVPADGAAAADGAGPADD